MIRSTIAILFFCASASAEYKHLNPDNTEVAPNRPPLTDKNGKAEQKAEGKQEQELNLDSMSQVSALMQGKQPRQVGEQRGPETMPPMAPFR